MYDCRYNDILGKYIEYRLLLAIATVHIQKLKTWTYFDSTCKIYYE